MLFKKTESILDKDQNLYINEGRLNLLYKSLPATSAMNILTALLLPLLFRKVVPSPALSICTGLIILSALLRGTLYICYKGWKKEKKTDLWKRLFNAGLLLTALSWGLSALILFPLGYPIQQAFLVLIMGGIVSGAVISLSADHRLSLIFTQIILIPLIGRNLFTESEIRTGIVILIIAYDLYISITSRKLYEQIRNNLIEAYNLWKGEDSLKMSERRYESIFLEASTGIFYYNSSLILKDCNRGFSAILHSPREVLSGLKMMDLPDKRIMPALKAALTGEEGYYEGLYHTLKSDRDIHVRLRTSPLRNAAGTIWGGVGIVEDISEKTRIEQEIHHQAYHDTLTNLPNRQLLTDRLSQALKSAQRHIHKGVILFLDLDKFKLINDTMGHQTGDLLLKEVGARLSSILRKEDTVSRIGGDEFVILLPEIISDHDSSVLYARSVADKIHSVLKESFQISGQTFHISTSIGVIIFNGDEGSPEDVLKFADTAMYHAKEQGRNRTSFFHQEMDSMMQEQVVLEADLREALKNNELDIFLQPIVNIPDNRISGAEALLRWNHKEKGFISPDKIILIAENTGQIVSLGRWIMAETLRIYGVWIKNRQFLLDFITINISTKQLMQPDFVNETIRCILDSAIPPERVVLEIREQNLNTDFDNTLNKMKLLRDFGVKFALDDFGMGCSSLGYLKKLPLSKLKIDRTFTADLLTDKDTLAMVETIMSIASHFNMKVITKGVEKKEQRDRLKDLGCPYYQGYFCSKPLPPEEFLAMAVRGI